ncbi:hypothetical protein ANRL1_03037 [Anaerolineae bacterium]|nr:hypothetical protein ANRL1_03037 [Anaerolineae bacterium]
MDYPSTADIESQIANYTLHFDRLKDDEIEWRFQPPPFVVAFIEFIERFQRIPSQDEFADYYITKNRDVLNDEFLRKWDKSKRVEKKRALIARLERAYPSFVRDIYFFAMLCENGIRVEYDPAQDVQGGVDLIVTHAGEKIQLHVFLDTPRSRQGRAKKDRRHRFAGKHLDVLLRRDKCKQIGLFWLPTLEDVRQIKHHLGIFDKEVEQ